MPIGIWAELPPVLGLLIAKEYRLRHPKVTSPGLLLGEVRNPERLQIAHPRYGSLADVR